MSDVMPVHVGPSEPGQIMDWEEGGQAASGPPRSPLERPLAAIRRYKFLIVGITMLGVLGGFVATRMVKPVYAVSATIWIETTTPAADRVGPIRSQELLNSQGWVELLRSFRIVDNVVRKLTLYLQPESNDDEDLFTGFAVANSFAAGTYEIEIDAKHKRWRLGLKGRAPLDSGGVADSVGNKFGFRWRLPDAIIASPSDRKAAFTVATPRETSTQLNRRLGTNLDQGSNFLSLALQDGNPQRAARTMNVWMEEYVNVAAELKKRNLIEFSKILRDQLDYAERNMKDAEQSLENFKIHTITLPQEGSPIAPGVSETRDPALQSFFNQKIEYDNLRSDREALERTIANAGSGNVPFEAALLIPSVATSPGAEALRKAFAQLYEQQAALTAARQVYTDEYQTVRDLLRSVATLQTQTIPTLAKQLLEQLKQRESVYDQRITSASADLQHIPARTIEEMRLKRMVAVTEGLYTTLKSRHAEATLAEASATPDVRILDSAVAPLQPTRNTKPRLLLIAIVGGFGAAIAFALLLDMIDHRVRYSEQVSKDLGLVIAGAIPRIPRGGLSAGSPEQVSGLIEAFRSIRMHVTYANPLPTAIAISSPAPGDGKSLIAANLAMSFADAGLRTVLVDADTRRGTLHELFAITGAPGLTDFLAGTAQMTSIIYPTAQEKLSIVPCGRRNRRSPELLTSSLLGVLVNQLRQSYDVVILDTPPLAAGVDAYAVASAAANLLMVVRIGKTDRRMAAAKLLVVDRLPIRVLGAVLNGVSLTGEYQYYGYVAGYALTEGEVEHIG